ncbi:MAG TPA: Rieske 2Fe-2S domain-containing protein [Candidatus Kapabacteria bacterium]|nr:Rieske 2Fe-2S domain-containing protein [Candidatus Kapabacteria bacterium]
MKEFVRVAALDDIPKRHGKVIAFEQENVEIALYNVGGTCYAISNICPHQHTPGLADSPVENGWITCPMHGWTFNVATGATLNGAKGIKTYAVKVLDGDVYIEKPEEEIPSWSW